MKFSLCLLLLLSSQAWSKWSVSTYNIRNFDQDPNAGATNVVELKKIIKSFQSDVMAFEEVVNVKAFKELMKSSLPGHIYEISKCGGGGKQHLAIAYNPKVFTFINTAEDASFSGTASGSCGSLRPLFLMNLQLKETKKFYVFGVAHLKAGGDEASFSQRWSQYAKLKEFARKQTDKNLILLGDFNTTGYNIRDEDFTKFESFLTSASLRTMSENLSCTSYWEGPNQTGIHQSSILDHIIIQDKNVAVVQDVELGAHCAKSNCKAGTPEELGLSYLSVSDHCPVRVTFK